eukprot:g6311.t1
MDSQNNPWIIENRSGVALRAYRAGPSSGTTATDELDKIMEVSLKNSPSKSENKEIKSLIGSVRERMDTLQVQYEDTRSVMAEMKELLLEQQEHIRKLQTKDAERQLVDSYVNENNRNHVPHENKTQEDKMKTARNEKKVNRIDNTSDIKANKESRPEEKDKKNTVVEENIAVEKDENTEYHPDPNVVEETQLRDLRKNVEKYKLEYKKASDMYDQERKTSLYWKRRAESNADTIGHLERIIQQQKRMINAMNSSSRKTNRGSSRSYRHKNSVSSSRRKKRSSTSSSSRSLRSLEGSLELNLSWPPLSSSSSSSEEEEDLADNDDAADEQKNDEGDLNGTKGAYKPEDVNDDNVGEEKPLSKSQEESFAIIQDFYDKRVESND